MNITYLPLIMQLTGGFCLIAALWLLLGPIVALVVAGLILCVLGFVLESRREQVNTSDERSRST